jgi:hypothetical protein
MKAKLMRHSNSVAIPSTNFRLVEFKRKRVIYTQSDPANNGLYVQEGGVTLCVINEMLTLRPAKELLRILEPSSGRTESLRRPRAPSRKFGVTPRTSSAAIPEGEFQDM